MIYPGPTTMNWEVFQTRQISAVTLFINQKLDNVFGCTFYSYLSINKTVCGTLMY